MVDDTPSPLPLSMKKKKATAPVATKRQLGSKRVQAKIAPTTTMAQVKPKKNEKK
jgi:hypothetical protein